MLHGAAERLVRILGYVNARGAAEQEARSKQANAGGKGCASVLCVYVHLR
jgi:hypothetical protein